MNFNPITVEHITFATVTYLSSVWRNAFDQRMHSVSFRWLNHGYRLHSYTCTAWAMHTHFERNEWIGWNRRRDKKVVLEFHMKMKCILPSHIIMAMAINFHLRYMSYGMVAFLAILHFAKIFPWYRWEQNTFDLIDRGCSFFFFGSLLWMLPFSHGSPINIRVGIITTIHNGIQILLDTNT